MVLPTSQTRVDSTSSKIYRTLKNQYSPSIRVFTNRFTKMAVTHIAKVRPCFQPSSYPCHSITLIVTFEPSLSRPTDINCKFAKLERKPYLQRPHPSTSARTLVALLLCCRTERYSILALSPVGFVVAQLLKFFCFFFRLLRCNISLGR